MGAIVYIALVHYPVYNKRGDTVSTCITGFDLHDIARTSKTFGVKKYFVVNPLPAQREFASKIFDFWMEEGSLEFNWTRAEAFRLISIKGTLDEAIEEIEKAEGKWPKVVLTSAKPKGAVRFEAMRSEIQKGEGPFLLVFGTGWGMAEEVFAKADAVLEPIPGKSEYNHLPVRSAIAIILDRLLGGRD